MAQQWQFVIRFDFVPELHPMGRLQFLEQFCVQVCDLHQIGFKGSGDTHMELTLQHVGALTSEDHRVIVDSWLRRRADIRDVDVGPLMPIEAGPAQV